MYTKDDRKILKIRLNGQATQCYTCYNTSLFVCRAVRPQTGGEKRKGKTRTSQKWVFGLVFDNITVILQILLTYLQGVVIGRSYTVTIQSVLA